MSDYGLGSLIDGMFNLAGGYMNDKANERQSELDYQRQKEFAQNSIQWKAQDAIKAGFHPLAALGTQSASYSPSGMAGGGVGDALANTGQALSRGVRQALDTQARKNSKLDLEIKQEQLKQSRLQTASMQKSLARMGQNPKPEVAAVIPKASPSRPAPLTKVKPASTNNRTVKNEKHGFELMNWGNGYKIVPSQEMSDGSDAQVGLSIANTVDRLLNPHAWYDVVKDKLPPAPKGKKWVMTRNIDGWNPVLKPSEYSPGLFDSTWDPSAKNKKRIPKKYEPLVKRSLFKRLF